MDTLPQGLASLPNEIILIIFDNIPKITDRRQFLKTCVLYNKITKHDFLQFEKNYKTLYGRMEKYCMEKFMVELCHDSYFDMIPISYITNKNSELIYALTVYNCLPLLKVAKENGCGLLLVPCFAISYGHLEILEWLGSFDRIAESSFLGATKNGYLDVLKWGKRNGYKLDCQLSYIAAENGHLDILKWAREYECYWDKKVCAVAAENGHFELLRWARENGCDWDDYTCANAALNGHLEILKWARKNGCDWDKFTCSNAAINGHLDIIKWAKENGCDWDIYTCANAMDKGHTEVFNWAKENGCEWDGDTCSNPFDWPWLGIKFDRDYDPF